MLTEGRLLRVLILERGICRDRANVGGGGGYQEAGTNCIEKLHGMLSSL